MKGDRVKKSEANEYWPKFYINDSGRPVIADSLSDIPTGKWVFQPRFGNMYGSDDVLMVKSSIGSYVFEVTGVSILWGSMVVSFLDEYTYAS